MFELQAYSCEVPKKFFSVDRARSVGSLGGFELWNCRRGLFDLPSDTTGVTLEQLPEFLVRMHLTAVDSVEPEQLRPLFKTPLAEVFYLSL